jgi:hypothetical protein
MPWIASRAPVDVQIDLIRKRLFYDWSQIEAMEQLLIRRYDLI